MAAPTSKFWSIHFTSLIALLVRIGFMLYGEWQDRAMVVKYTDIDYHVFTDAARYVHQGLSPYKRATYRYTPLLAMALTPNITIHMAFGKVLFILFDILTGYLIYGIQLERGFRPTVAVCSSWFWLFNPIPIVVSSRGNAESIMAGLVLATLYFALQRRAILTGIFLASAVHFKIFPIIYSLPLFLMIGESKPQTPTPSSLAKRLYGLCKWMVQYVFQPARIILVIVCVSTLAGITVWLTMKSYGKEFLAHTYLFHVLRKDTRHNFSLYFYMLYLIQDSPSSTMIGILTFIPQMLLTVGFAFKYYQDICFCCFLQTFAFVTFNKVCTSQYFLWYLCLLPLVISHVKLSMKRALAMITSWFAAQALWLLPAYFLEFKGHNTFIYIWLASIVFFVVNLWIMCEFITKYQPIATITKNKTA